MRRGITFGNKNRTNAGEDDFSKKKKSSRNSQTTSKERSREIARNYFHIYFLLMMVTFMNTKFTLYNGTTFRDAFKDE